MSKLTLDDVISKVKALLPELQLSIEMLNATTEYVEEGLEKATAVLFKCQMEVIGEILEMMEVICREIKFRD